MNKKEFTKYIGEQLNGKSLEEQVKILSKIQSDYLPELIHSRQKKLGLWVPAAEKSNYTFCEKCNRYSLTKNCKENFVKEIRTETTYIDCGYGDDDMMGDVEYMVSYVTCPRCGFVQEKQKIYMRTLREWNRKEGRR